MENSDNILGGVSPLKKRQSSRGGKRAGQATATAKRRGGFAKSKGKRGAGGANVGGYNVATSFNPAAAWKAPPSGGVIKPTKPFGWTPTGDIDIDDPKGWKKWNPGTEGTPGRVEETLMEGVGTWDKEKEGRLPTYEEAWKLNLENVRGKYKDKQDYIDKETARKEAGEKGATEEEIHKSIHTKKYIPETEGKPGYWQYFDPEGNEISESEFAKYDPGGKTSF
jgi:hypothetical protein